MRGAAWSLVLVVMAVSASVGLGGGGSSSGGQGQGNGQGGGKGNILGKNDGCNIVAGSRILVDLDKQACLDKHHCYDDSDKSCYMHEQTMEQAEKHEQDCLAVHVDERVVTDHTNKVDCMDSYNCWKEMGDNSFCFTAKSNPCTQEKAARIYMNRAFTRRECRNYFSGCWDNNECYLKEKDVCYIEKESRNYLESDQTQTEESCARANSCFDYADEKCYLKDVLCVTMPRNCRLERTTACALTNGKCGVGQKVEEWACCEPKASKCQEFEEKVIKFNVTKKCCDNPCTPAVSATADASSTEPVSEDPYSKILTFEGKTVKLPNGTFVSPCRQVENDCVANGFHAKEVFGKVYFLRYYRDKFTATFIA